MRKHILIAILFLHYPTFAKESVLIENVTVVSSHLQGPLQKAHVLISDGRIKTVSSSNIKKTVDTQVIDGTTLYLAPGIMDSCSCFIYSWYGVWRGACGTKEWRTC